MMSLFKRGRRLSASEAGLLQAFGVIAYCTIIAGTLNHIGKADPSGLTGAVLGLSLLVFSAAVTGSLVFAYPAVLAFKGQLRQAGRILAYTLSYLLGLIILLVSVILVVTQI